MDKRDEVVLLLHGIFRTGYSMRPLAKALERAGYRTVCWHYNSMKGTLPYMVERLRQRLPELGTPAKVHAIGHSMGGLILRHLLTGSSLPVERLVLMGTPSQGSQFVASLDWLFRQPVAPKAIRDMRPDSRFIGALPLPEIEIGVVAGVEKFNPVNPVSWVNKWVLGDVPHDGTVEVSSVKLARMADYLEVPVNHSFLPTSRRVIPAVVRFIETGKFA